MDQQKTGNMQRLILLLCLLGGMIMEAGGQSAFVGINTEDPRGVLHIDGGVTPGDASDDVLIDTEGRLGAGLQEPTARVHTHADTPGGALRIQDGSEGDGYILFSDANGVGTWAPLGLTSGVWYAALYDSQLLDYTTNLGTRVLTHYAGSLISPMGGGAVDATAGSIVIPKAGRYRLTLSVHWESNRTDPYLPKAVLRIGGSPHKTFSLFGRNTGGVNDVMPTFVSILELGAGDVLTLATDETAANSANKARAILFMAELLYQ
jgi:hypothetical protein